MWYTCVYLSVNLCSKEVDYSVVHATVKRYVLWITLLCFLYIQRQRNIVRSHEVNATTNPETNVTFNIINTGIYVVIIT